MFETLNTEKKTPELHCLEIVSLSVSSEALSTKSLQEAQIFFLFELSCGAFSFCVSGCFSVHEK